MIHNPVLTGLHPDPSVLRVGEDVYLATSTFEWAPGVLLHRSTDLVTWRPLGGALDSDRLLDLTGCLDSGGVWAPNLTHADGLFHLVYSTVSSYTGGFTDSPNYLVTAPSAEGPWSDPVLLNARGFDASLFHDGADSWLVSLVHDWRPGRGGSAGLEATRYDRAARRLVGEPVTIGLPPADGWVEGPNLYRRGDWYYLLTADGGTGYDHQVSVSRSRSLVGPYVRSPHGPLVTSRHRPDLPLQKAGHGSLVETADGRWYLAFLVARPLGTRGPCLTGRETALAPVVWTQDGWPEVPGGVPEVEVPTSDREAQHPESGHRTHGGLAPGSALTTGAGVEGHGEEGEPNGAGAEGEVAGGHRAASEDGWGSRSGECALGPVWSTLRRHATPDWVAQDDDPAWLTVRGGRSPMSLVGPSLVARRVTEVRCSFEVTADVSPGDFQQVAGLTAYYNTRNWHAVQVTADDDGRPVIQVVSCDRGELTVHETHETHAAAAGRPVRLGVDLHDGSLRFRWDGGAGWQDLGPMLDATVLSDEHAAEVYDGQVRSLGFTGAFLGVWVWDLSGAGRPARFGAPRYTVGARAARGR